MDYKNDMDRIKKHIELYKEKIRKQKKEQEYNIYKELTKEEKEIVKKEKKLIRDRIYREVNKEKRKEKFNCECGGKYTYTHKIEHMKTKKHLKYIENL